MFGAKDMSFETYVLLWQQEWLKSKAKSIVEVWPCAIPFIYGPKGIIVFQYQVLEIKICQIWI